MNPSQQALLEEIVPDDFKIHAMTEVGHFVCRRESTVTALLDALSEARKELIKRDIENADEFNAHHEEMLKELAEARKGAERWCCMSGLMFLGNVFAEQDADGGYKITLDPAENLLGVSWKGNSPEEAIDASMSDKGGE